MDKPLSTTMQECNLLVFYKETDNPAFSVYPMSRFNIGLLYCCMSKVNVFSKRNIGKGKNKFPLLLL